MAPPEPSTPLAGTWEQMLWQVIGAGQVNRAQFTTPNWITFTSETTMGWGESPWNDPVPPNGQDTTFTLYRKGKRGDDLAFQIIEGNLDWYAGGENSPDKIYWNHYLNNFHNAIANYDDHLDSAGLRSIANSFDNVNDWLVNAKAVLKPTLDELGGGNNPDFAGNAAGEFHRWLFNLSYELDNLRSQLSRGGSSWSTDLRTNANDIDTFVTTMRTQWDAYWALTSHPHTMLRDIMTQIEAQCDELDRTLRFEIFVGDDGTTYTNTNGPEIGSGQAWWFKLTFGGRPMKEYDLSKASGFSDINTDLKTYWNADTKSYLDDKLKPNFDTMRTNMETTSTRMSLPIRIHHHPGQNGPNGGQEPPGGNGNGPANIPTPPNIPSFSGGGSGGSGSGLPDLGGGGGTSFSGSGGSGANLPKLGDLGGGSGGSGLPSLIGSGTGGSGLNLPGLGGGGGTGLGSIGGGGLGSGGSIPLLPGLGAIGGGKAVGGVVKGGAGSGIPGLGGGSGGLGGDDIDGPGAGLDGPTKVGTTIPGLGNPGSAANPPGFDDDAWWDSPSKAAFPTGGGTAGAIAGSPLGSGAGASFGSFGTAGTPGAAAAAGAGSTTTAGGYGGMPFMPPMGGMGGAGRQGQEKERERTTWLAEDEEVWGTDPDCSPAVIGRGDLPDLEPADQSWQPAQTAPAATPPGPRRTAPGRGNR